MHSLVIALIALAAFDHRFGGGEAGVLSLSLQEALSYAVLYFLMVHAVVFRGSRSTSPGRAGDGVVRIVAWYGAWLLLGAAANALFFSNVDALHGLKDTLPGLVLFAALVRWVDSKEKLRDVHVGLSVILVLLGALAVSQSLWGGPYMNRLDPNALFKLDYRGASLVRHPVVGMVGSPNTNAVFLMPLAVITAGRLLEESRTPAASSLKPWLAGAALVCFIAVVLTQAKIATALGLVAVSLLFLRSRWNVSATPARAGALFVSLLLAACLSIAVLARFSFVLPETFALGTMVQRMSLDQSA